MGAVRPGHATLASTTLAIVTLIAMAGCGSDSNVSDPAERPARAVRIAVNGPDSIVLRPGQSIPVGVTAFDAHGAAVPAPPPSWSSSDTQIATITANGVVTALAGGTAMIRARAGGLSAEAPVTVRDLAVGLLPQGEFGDTIQLAPGQTLQLSAIEYDRHNSKIVQPLADLVPVWLSSHPELATVSSTGLVTAVAEGDVQVGVSLDSLTAYRPIRIARTSGSVTVRFVDAIDDLALTLRSNAGEPVIPLRFGDVREQTIPAGTLFVTADGFWSSSPPTCSDCFDAESPAQGFIGFLRANTKATLVATANPFLGFALAPLWDWDRPVDPDSAMVRVLVVTLGGFNVYFVEPGAPPGVSSLRGCYLDWPYGVTAYSPRLAKPFDIVLQYGKGVTGPESARFTVTPQAGRATTYVLTGQSAATLKVLTLVDH